jgi:two-component system response regulator RegA
MTASFLILDDDKLFAETLARLLSRRGFAASVAQLGEEAMKMAESMAYNYVVIDLRLAEDSGLRWISPLRAALPKASILLLTGYASIATTVQALKRGADNCLPKPAGVDAILTALQADIPNENIPEELHVAARRPSLAQMEWEYIQKTMCEHEGNVSATARALHLHRRTLQRKLLKKPR